MILIIELGIRLNIYLAIWHENTGIGRNPRVVVYSHGPINNSDSFYARTAYIAIINHRVSNNNKYLFAQMTPEY